MAMETPICFPNFGGSKVKVPGSEWHGWFLHQVHRCRCHPQHPRQRRRTVRHSHRLRTLQGIGAGELLRVSDRLQGIDGHGKMTIPQENEGFCMVSPWNVWKTEIPLGFTSHN